MNKSLSRLHSAAGKGKDISQLLVASLMPEKVIFNEYKKLNLKVPKGVATNFLQTNLSKPGVLVVHLPKEKVFLLKIL